MSDSSILPNVSEDSYPEAEDNTIPWDTSILFETIQAHGGESFLQQKTLKITGHGEFTTPPQTGKLKVPLTTFTLSIATEGRSRLEAQAFTGNLLFVVRGHRKGGFVQLVGRILELPSEQTNNIEPTEFLRAIVRENYRVVPATGMFLTATNEQESLIPFLVYQTNGRVTQVFVDTETKLLRKMVTTTSRGEMTVRLSNYQTVSGISVFGESELLENGESIFKLIATKIVVDERIDDKLFQQP